MQNIKIKKKLSSEELKELDLHIDYLLNSIEPITKQLINPRFCLTYEKARFTAGYEYKFGKGGKRYRTGEKLPPISSKEDIRSAILKSKHFKDFKKVNIGLHSWNQNKNGDFLIFIDIDNKKALQGKAQEFKNKIKINSLTQTSASGGKHILIFVKSNTELKNYYGMVPNVDLICRPQSYILAAGSTTIKGSYNLETTGEIATVDFKSIPLLLTDATAAINLSGTETSESIFKKWLSTEHEGDNPKHKEERVYGHISQKTKDAFNKAFKEKIQIKQGKRMHFLRHVSSKFLSENTKVSKKEFVEFCHNINEEFMNPELPFQEVEDFACSYQKDFYSSIRKFKLTIGEDLKSAIDSIKQNLLILPKEEDYKNFVQCSIVDSKIQNLIQELLNKKFKKNLPDGTVSKLFKESGFSKIQSRKKESRGIRFYNISPSSISSLLSSMSVGREEKSFPSMITNVGCSISPPDANNVITTITPNTITNVGCSIATTHSNKSSLNQLKEIINQMEIKTQFQSEINLKAQEQPVTSEAPITLPPSETKLEIIPEPAASLPAAAASSEGCEEKISQEEYEKQILESVIEDGMMVYKGKENKNILELFSPRDLIKNKLY